MRAALKAIRRAYGTAKTRCAEDCGGPSASTAILETALLCLRFLADECRTVPLTSRVPGKEYISFARKSDPTGVVSRPANTALFLAEGAPISKVWEVWTDPSTPQDQLARVAYTVALAPCLAMEIFDRQNKKAPATYFECLIGHILARSVHVAPEKRASLQVLGKVVRLTMDFLFHVPDGVRLHVAVKMSTRERVVQAWAHQRILDSAFGPGAYKGIMVLFSETKLDSRSHEVVEICVPDQWLTYQTLLAKMYRIYYFDLPERYESLSRDYPQVVTVKHFGEFFTEKDSVLHA